MNASKKSKTRSLNRADATALVSAEHLKWLHTAPLTKGVLSDLLIKSLAAYVVLQAKEPVSQVITGLLEIEIEAASLVESFYSDEKQTINLKGTLASIISFIPIGGQNLKNEIIPKESNNLSPCSSVKQNSSHRTKK